MMIILKYYYYHRVLEVIYNFLIFQYVFYKVIKRLKDKKYIIYYKIQTRKNGVFHCRLLVRYSRYLNKSLKLKFNITCDFSDHEEEIKVPEIKVEIKVPEIKIKLKIKLLKKKKLNQKLKKEKLNQKLNQKLKKELKHQQKDKEKEVKD